MAASFEPIKIEKIFAGNWTESEPKNLRFVRATGDIHTGMTLWACHLKDKKTLLLYLKKGMI